jgi:hypothetical protein
MTTKNYKTNPEKMTTNELMLLKENMEIDTEKFKFDLEEIILELIRRPDYSKQIISNLLQ